MKVIGFCGTPGSGKSTAIKSIKDLGIIVTMGDIIRSEVISRNMEPIGENLGKIAKELRNKGGPGIIARKCVELIKSLNSNVIFVDGVRSLSEVNEFKKSWKFPLIAIDVNEEERLKRLLKRGRSDDPIAIEDLRERDKREIGFGLADVVNKADHKILNDSTIKELKNKTRELVLEIIKNY